MRIPVAALEDSLADRLLSGHPFGVETRGEKSNGTFGGKISKVGKLDGNA